VYSGRGTLAVEVSFLTIRVRVRTSDSRSKCSSSFFLSFFSSPTRSTSLDRLTDTIDRLNRARYE
jgi:hypothetical protein